MLSVFRIQSHWWRFHLTKPKLLLNGSHHVLAPLRQLKQRSPWCHRETFSVTIWLHHRWRKDASELRTSSRKVTESLSQFTCVTRKVYLFFPDSRRV
jgi:hypothetical protein